MHLFCQLVLAHGFARRGAQGKERREKGLAHDLLSLLGVVQRDEVTEFFRGELEVEGLGESRGEGGVVEGQGLEGVESVPSCLVMMMMMMMMVGDRGQVV